MLWEFLLLPFLQCRIYINNSFGYLFTFSVSLEMGNLLGTFCVKAKTEKDVTSFRGWNNWLEHDVQSVEEIILGPNFFRDKTSFIEPIYIPERDIDQI